MNDKATDLKIILKKVSAFTQRVSNSRYLKKATPGIAIFILVLSGCGRTSFPPEAEAKVRTDIREWYAAFDDVTVSNVQIDPIGAGKILPFDEAHGRQEVICIHLAWDQTEGNSTKHKRMSTLVYRTGNLWDMPYHSEKQTSWLEHSCPGTYEKYQER